MVHCHKPSTFLGWCGVLFFICLVSSLISLVPLGLAALIGSLPGLVGEKDEEFPLISLKEKDGVAGRFYFLGSGCINDQQYYFWYCRNPDGSIFGGKTVRVPGVEIYECRDMPRRITFKTEYKNKWLGKYLWLIGIDLRNTEWCERFYIPKGSIKEGYNL